MEILTERMILRRWKDSDAEDLYKYACDPDIGPAAGWPVHRSVEESREVIRSVLSADETYAICLKGDSRPIGSVGLKLGGSTDLTDRDDECELGYWIGKPFWGQGMMPEAVEALMRHAFLDLGMQKVWAGYYEGNEKSKRVQEKCGFRFQRKDENVDVTLMHEKRNEYINLITRADWEQKHNELNDGERKIDEQKIDERKIDEQKIDERKGKKNDSPGMVVDAAGSVIGAASTVGGVLAVVGVILGKIVLGAASIVIAPVYIARDMMKKPDPGASANQGIPKLKTEEDKHDDKA